MYKAHTLSIIIDVGEDVSALPVAGKANFYLGYNTSTSIGAADFKSHPTEKTKIIAEMEWIPKNTAETTIANTEQNILVKYGQLSIGESNIKLGELSKKVKIPAMVEVEMNGTKKQYATMDQALKAIGTSDNCTLKLLSGIDMGGFNLTLKNTITLELNGKKITGNGANGATVVYQGVSGKTLTFKDSVGTGRVENTRGEAVIKNDAGGTIEIYGGTFESESEVIYNQSTGTVKILGGAVTAVKNTAIVNAKGGKIEIKDGTVSAESYTIRNSNENGIIDISGGIIKATTAVGSVIGNLFGGKIKISGGMIATDGVAIANPDDGYYSGVIDFTGGIILGECTGNDIPAVTEWTVKGDQILSADITIPSNKVFTIHKNATLTIEKEKTVTNNGTLKLYGAITGEGTLVGEGKYITFMLEDITIPDQYYTGSEIKPVPVLADSKEVMGKTFKVDKSDFTGPTYANNKEVGTTATVTYTNSEDKSTSIVKNFSIVQSGTEFTGGIKTYKDANVTNTFTYGDTMIVKVTPKATGAAPRGRSVIAPLDGQMALYVGDKQICDGVNAENGIYSMTYNTANKDLVIGSNDITAKYVGTASMAEYSESVSVTLNQKAITSATVSAGTTKSYDGTSGFTNVVLDNLVGLESGDIVIGVANGDADNINVGTPSFIATAVTLSDKDAAYYSLAPTAVSGTVTITPVSIAITGGTITTKGWDKKTDATVTALTFDGLVSGENLNITADYSVGTPAFKTADVGTNKEVTGTATLSNSQTAANYRLKDNGQYSIWGGEIKQSETTFEGGIQVDRTDKTYTYGDSITATVTPKPTGEASRARSIVAPGAGQMALFVGEQQISDAVDAVNGSYTMTYNTANKALVIGENSITVKFVENENLADYSENVTITFKKKSLTAATIATGTSKPYDGNADIINVVLENLTGKESIDTVTATAEGSTITGDAENAKVGTHNFKAKTVTLSGKDAAYYSMEPSVVTGEVKITAIAPTVTVSAEKKESRLRAAIGDHEDTIILTATTAGTNNEKPEGSVAFKHGETTLETVETKNGVASYDWKNPPASSCTITAEFIASDTNYLSDMVTGSITFDIDKAEQKTLKVTDVTGKTYGDQDFTLTTTGGSGKGEVTFSVPENNGVLTLNGDKATIVGAGTVTITATKAADSNYNAATATYNLKVSKAASSIMWEKESQSTIYTGKKAVIEEPKVTLVNNESYSGSIQYAYKYIGGFTRGLFEGYTDGLPTNAGKYEIKAHIAESSNYLAADSSTMELTINKSKPAITINTMEGKTYDGKPVAKPAEANISITGGAYDDVTFVYSKKSDMSNPLDKAPKNVSSYYVQAKLAESDNTKAAESNIVSFKINAASLTITGGIVSRREYNGVTDAKVNELEFNGLVNGETLEVSSDYEVGTPTYDSAEAGNNKTVNGTATLRSNVKTNNYILAGQYSITNQIIDKNTESPAPVYVEMNDAKGIDTFTFAAKDGDTTPSLYEYSMDDGITWIAVTENPISVGNIAGNIKIRTVETANYAPGIIYTHSTPFTAWLVGTVSISGTFAYGETLTASTEGYQTSAQLHYQWKIGTKNIGTDSSTLMIPGVAVGQNIMVEVTATGYEDKLISETTTTVEKKIVTATSGIISKTYDGTNTVEEADRTLTITKVNESDDITVTAPTATYDNAEVGTEKAISFGTLSVTGEAADWYLVMAPTEVKGSIIQKTIGDNTDNNGGGNTTTKPSTKDTAKTNIAPKSGDNANIQIWMILMLLSVGGICIVTRKRTNR